MAIWNPSSVTVMTVFAVFLRLASVSVYHYRSVSVCSESSEAVTVEAETDVEIDVSGSLSERLAFRRLPLPASSAPAPTSESSSTPTGADQRLERLSGECFDTGHSPAWWIYVWCSGASLRQLHFDQPTRRVDVNNLLGQYQPEESSPVHQIFRNDVADCLDEETNELRTRYSEVSIECCPVTATLGTLAGTAEGGDNTGLGHGAASGTLASSRDRNIRLQQQLADKANGPLSSIQQQQRLLKLTTWIDSVSEPVTCSYYLKVCSDLACPSVSNRGSGVGLNQFGSQSSELSTNIDIDIDIDRDDNNNANANADTINQGHDTTKQLLMQAGSDKVETLPMQPHTGLVDESMQRQLMEQTRKMFYRAYNAYIDNALPEGELRPITCEGAAFDPAKIPLVTLVDTLDTLVVLGDYREFRRAISVVREHYVGSLGSIKGRVNGFDLDVNISVFETTIRMLGGLLSAHLFAIDSRLAIYPESPDSVDSYDGCLLRLAVDLGQRLLPAFRTRTGIPYGTVNLRHGVPRGESEVASTAGAGSLLVEFFVLSLLTGDSRFERAAASAIRALHKRRSSLGLMGKHIHVKTGKWSETVSGIGSNSDSFYEYLIKGYLLGFVTAPNSNTTHADATDSGQQVYGDMLGMFSDCFASIKRHVQAGDWFGDVEMGSGQLRRHRVESLHAFWPGLEAALGYPESAAAQLNAFYSVWDALGLLPEELDQTQLLQGRGGAQNGFYPLRPELIESTYYQYRATGDRTWLSAGALAMDSIERLAYTGCGYASLSLPVSNANVANTNTVGSASFPDADLVDVMPSFFLSETCKYLFLLFDDTHWSHDRSWIFSTEAHPFDMVQLRHELQRVRANASIGDGATSKRAFSSRSHGVRSAPLLFGTEDISQQVGLIPLLKLPNRCPRRLWWDAPRPFQLSYSTRQGNLAAPALRKPRRPSPSDEARMALGFKNNIAASNVAQNSDKLKYGPSKEFDTAAHAAADRFTATTRSLMWAAADSLHRLSSAYVDVDVTTDANTNDIVSNNDNIGVGVRTFLTQKQLLYDAGFADAAMISIDPLAFSVRSLSNATWLMARRDVQDMQWVASERFYKSVKALQFSSADDEPTSSVSDESETEAGSEAADTSVDKLSDSTSRWQRDSLTVCLARDHAAWVEFIAATNVVTEGKATFAASTATTAAANVQSPTSIGASAVGATSNGRKEAAIQNLDVDMGELGKFNVAVFTDGFEVKRYGKLGAAVESLEISGIGQNIVFVREVENPESSFTVISELLGPTVRCSIDIFATSTSDAEADIDGLDASPSVSESVWSRSCASATFGPRSIAVPLVVELAVPDPENSALCSPLPKHSDRRSRGSNGSGKRKRWWPWQRSDPVSDDNSSDSIDPASTSQPSGTAQASRYLGKAVLAMRGTCMFEDKARNAEDAGALALIVANSEDALFLMSGKQTGDDLHIQPTPTSVTIPSVMLSSADASSLLTAYLELTKKGVKPRARLSLVALPSALDSQVQGSDAFPKVTVRPNFVTVQGRHNWSVLMASPSGSGKDWQLYLARASDLLEPTLNSISAFTAEGKQPVTTTQLLDSSAVQDVHTYSQLLSEQCRPGAFVEQDSGHIFLGSSMTVKATSAATVNTI